MSDGRLQINLFQINLKTGGKNEYLLFLIVFCLCFFFFFSACKHYFEKYPGHNDLLCEVEGAGFWFQRKSIATVLRREELISMDDFFVVVVPLRFMKVVLA